MHRLAALAVLAVILSARETKADVFTLTRAEASHFASLALKMMRHIASALPPRDPVRRVLERAAAAHARDALAHVASGDYLGEHWLASFAVYMLTAPSLPLRPRRPLRLNRINGGRTGSAFHLVV